MAVLAKERRARLQHSVNCRAVRVVADAAILGHRLVVMHERTTLLQVAGVAGFNHAGFDHLFRIVAVGVVAVRAADLAFEYRVARGLADLNPLFLVAGKANLRLGQLVAYVVMAGVDLVAGRAGDILAGVHAGFPVSALGVTLVAGQAGLALNFCRGTAFFAEYDGGLGTFADAGRPVDVGFAGAVATGAGRCAAIGNRAMFCFADLEDRVFLIRAVAACTDGIAFEDKILARGLCGILRQCRLRHCEQA